LASTKNSGPDAMRHHKQYNIREISSQDILAGGFSETLENLSVKVTGKNNALKVFLEIQSNPLHKVFVADHKNMVLGAVTLLVEPQFIYS
jgi:hypothetical protein